MNNETIKVNNSSMFLEKKIDMSELFMANK
jgi:hypothetical protein